ncbi:hypothetical protein EJB05_41704 [Eragrostis curvula]|uniref:WDR36/Utp21 C-terminal domain-containing protein n=1 Tax=Eragrostis curvula TaxID=38414 RepID=A0A5J9TAE9_9POAL|nr:hypothetical protein EJB05_41704 [Eragrostis curvula]
MGIFEPFRAIGYITSGGVPFSVQRLGAETFVTVSVGKAFHVYNCAKLNLVLAGPQLPKKIRALASYKDYTLLHMEVILQFSKGPIRHDEKVNILYLFGEYVLSADIKVAVGCSDGSVHVHNIRYDEELMSFNHQIRGAVTALSFRTAADNSIKMWIFDSNDGDARLLRFRSGHSAPPRCIRFYGNGKCVLSAGQDRAFRLFSVVQDQQSRELSQRHVTKRAKKLRVKEEEIKLKPVITFDCGTALELAVFLRYVHVIGVMLVTCHMDTPQAYVWRLQNFVIGEHILTPSSGTATPIKACVISACGNFTILGTEGGWMEKFNLQSGISRGSYIDTSLQCAHDGEVVGLACDATNGSLISAGYHGDIKVWGFKSCKLKSRLDVGKSVTKISYHRANGLLATVADDMDSVYLMVICLQVNQTLFSASTMLMVMRVVRNKPIEPPKKPEKAPFFLPSVPSLSGEILFGFYRLLERLVTVIFRYELRMLQIIDDDESENMEDKPELQSISLLLDYFIHELSCRNNFEFVQAVLKLFLKIHGETMRRYSVLQGKVKKLLEVQSLVWQKVDKMFQSARCMVTFLSNSQF